MMYYNWTTSGWMMGGTILVCLAIIGLVIFFVFQQGTSSTREPRETPLALAERRFADGQITGTEFAALRQTLIPAPTLSVTPPAEPIKV